MSIENVSLLLRLPALIALVGLGRSSVYCLVRAGAFPAPLRIGARAVAWRADEVERWMSTRTRAVGCSHVTATASEVRKRRRAEKRGTAVIEG